MMKSKTSSIWKTSACRVKWGEIWNSLPVIQDMGYLLPSSVQYYFGVSRWGHFVCENAISKTLPRLQVAAKIY